MTFWDNLRANSKASMTHYHWPLHLIVISWNHFRLIPMTPLRFHLRGIEKEIKIKIGPCMVRGLSFFMFRWYGRIALADRSRSSKEANWSYLLYGGEIRKLAVCRNGLMDRTCDELARCYGFCSIQSAQTASIGHFRPTNRLSICLATWKISWTMSGGSVTVHRTPGERF